LLEGRVEPRTQAGILLLRAPHAFRLLGHREAQVSVLLLNAPARLDHFFLGPGCLLGACDELEVQLVVLAEQAAVFLAQWVHLALCLHELLRLPVALLVHGRQLVVGATQVCEQGLDEGC